MPSVTATAQFKVTGVPKISMSASVNSPVDIGQYAHATLTLNNTGTAAANVSVSGADTFSGSNVGGWKTVTASVPVGQTVPVNTQTVNPIPSNLASDTITATFTASY